MLGGHSTRAGSRAALSNFNIWNSSLSKSSKYQLVTLNWLTAYMVAYSRIEAHRHYPEDVFAGVALGYWLTMVAKKTFTNGDRRGCGNIAIDFDAQKNFTLNYQVSF